MNIAPKNDCNNKRREKYNILCAWGPVKNSANRKKNSRPGVVHAHMVTVCADHVSAALRTRRSVYNINISLLYRYFNNILWRTLRRRFYNILYYIRAQSYYRYYVYNIIYNVCSYFLAVVTPWLCSRNN